MTVQGLVLLTEDDMLVRETIADLLELDGFQVAKACNADEAMTILEADPQSVAILVTDLSMPGENGIALVKRVRGLRPGLPAIILTGVTEEPPCAGLEGRGFCVLRKPVLGDDLAQHIKRLIA
ncbi:MAG TPA: response regulator [Rhodopila sp.]|uniref:response regulator n=1 Tax=Rhodopila sp. TaxID=2480087 RepID=UPI002C12277E|nr:response regulator [Rhodopila sp.]HVY17324.1 response regulator [Rhodopila sp.]